MVIVFYWLVVNFVILFAVAGEGKGDGGIVKLGKLEY
jgi:hypothetical protein